MTGHGCKSAKDIPLWPAGTVTATITASPGETQSLCPCPRCLEPVFARGIESSALQILHHHSGRSHEGQYRCHQRTGTADVATFLLNEKYSEIYAIEARPKVSIVIDPHIHLETPHYKIVPAP